MKTKKAGKKSNKKSPSGKAPYYFHSDEDFREDKEWGKPKLTETLKQDPSEKPSH
ncbi:hypothetical protein [Pedobacter nyackensis]|uniref:Uncharacterized protein n=1 Tax=Pedobacter nyackensis TaxID=475255 RepID=A0A1W2F9Q0_9SPHI|nr:hypothetical protein [Pedobacter nyackensis]SMD18650.1 hypothetical protein SAMN04488101_1285 [Pedobacter nyackensis]